MKQDEIIDIKKFSVITEDQKSCINNFLDGNQSEFESKYSSMNIEDRVKVGISFVDDINISFQFIVNMMGTSKMKKFGKELWEYGIGPKYDVNNGQLEFSKIVSDYIYYRRINKLNNEISNQNI